MLTNPQKLPHTQTRQQKTLAQMPKHPQIKTRTLWKLDINSSNYIGWCLADSKVGRSMDNCTHVVANRDGRTLWVKLTLLQIVCCWGQGPVDKLRFMPPDHPKSHWQDTKTWDCLLTMLRVLVQQSFFAHLLGADDGDACLFPGQELGMERSGGR